MQQRQVLLLPYQLTCFHTCFLIILALATAQNTTNTSSPTYNITKGSNITKPGCPSKCGNITVPYPFGIGIGSGCAINSGFEINCDTTAGFPIPFIMGTKRVYDLSDSEMRIYNDLSWMCYSSKGDLVQRSPELEMSFGASTPYSFSTLNRFTVVGCDDGNVISSKILANDGTKIFADGCNTACGGATDVVAGQCMSVGCCQLSIPKGMKFFNTSFYSGLNHTTVWSYNPCSYAFLGEESRFRFRGLQDMQDMNFPARIKSSVPLVLDWAVGINLTCAEAQKQDDYACQENSQCVNSDTSLGGYRCICKSGYKGNPYINCQDIDECADPNTNSCAKICINTPDSHKCSCPEGYTGDGKKNGRGCIKPNPEFPWIKFSVGVGVGFMSLVVGITWLYFSIKKRKLIELRKKFFEQNGGFLLKQLISSNEGGVGATKIFTAEELKKATKNYANDRILGRGGNGVVYKGILPDNHIVAIKKSLFVDENQIVEFINEVLIITQVNHRNMVRLFGCCLEAQVPLLVYEYVSHGTLYEHIHNYKNGASWLSLQNRLRIAIETANSLAYLHSFASTPIIHRDVKSTNILLDKSYTAKVADFGASRLIPFDQTHVTTLVKGTLGYLDPEYFHSGQLTEKTDVYSFGVVLAELLTGRNAISEDKTDEEKCLAKYFVLSMEKKMLFQTLDPRVVREGSLEQLEKIAELVKSCLHLHGVDRPTMKEVAMELESLRKFTKNNPWPNGHGHDEENEDEYLSDLFTIPKDSNADINNLSGQYSSNLYTNSSDFSGQNSSDISSLMYSK